MPDRTFQATCCLYPPLHFLQFQPNHSSLTSVKFSKLLLALMSLLTLFPLFKELPPPPQFSTQTLVRPIRPTSTTLPLPRAPPGPSASPRLCRALQPRAAPGCGGAQRSRLGKGVTGRTGARASEESFYLGAVVLRTELLAEFGDSSDPQRAARPQRTVYSKGRRWRVKGLGKDGPEPSAHRVKHKTLLKTGKPKWGCPSPSWPPSLLVTPAYLALSAPLPSESAPSPINTDPKVKDGRVLGTAGGRSTTE